MSCNRASCGPDPRPLRRSLFGPRAQAHHSSGLWTFGSASRGPHATPITFQSDGFAAIASRQHSVRPLDAMSGMLTVWSSAVRLAPVQVLRDRGHQLFHEAIEGLEGQHRAHRSGTSPSRCSARRAYPQMRPSAHAAVSTARPPRTRSRPSAWCGRRSCARSRGVQNDEGECKEADQRTNHGQIAHQQQLHPARRSGHAAVVGAGAPPGMEGYGCCQVHCGAVR